MSVFYMNALAARRQYRVYRPQNSAELAAIGIPIAGSLVLLKAGVTYAANAMPGHTQVDVTWGVSGTGPKPIVSGLGTLTGAWTFDAGNNVYAYPALADRNMGLVLEDGTPMRFAQWQGSLAATAATMVVGPSPFGYWKGNFTFDPTNRILYIRPSTAGVAGKVFTSSINTGFGAQQSGCGLEIDDASHRSKVDGIRFEHLTRHGIVVNGANDVKITNVEFRYIGPYHPSTIVSLVHGNCIESVGSTNGLQVNGVLAEDVFDTVVTQQQTSGGFTSDNLDYGNITAHRHGMHLAEFSLFDAGQTITDVLVHDCTSTDWGNGWSGDRDGAGLNIFNGIGAGASANRIFGHNITMGRAFRLYLGSGHGGTCGIQDSSCASSTQGFNGSGGTNLYRNVSDPNGPWGNLTPTALDLRTLLVL